MQTDGDSTVWAGLGGLLGAVVFAVGVGIVAVLAMRAMGEWRVIEHTPGAGRAPGPRRLSVSAPDLAALRDLAVDVAVRGRRAAVGHGRRSPGGPSTPSRPRPTWSPRWTGPARPCSCGGCGSCGPTTASSARRGRRTPAPPAWSWVVDPLDGTTNYLYRHPGWNVSVGATVDGVPDRRAPSSSPSQGDVFAAATGLGATRNGRALRIGPPAPLGQAPRGHRLRLRPGDPAGPGRGARPTHRPRSATSAAAARRPPTCARWRAGDSTPTTRPAWPSGTASPPPSSPGRRAPGSRCDPTPSSVPTARSRPTPTASTSWSTCSSGAGVLTATAP